MKNKIGAIFSATIILILFVLIPHLLPSYVPPDLASQIEQSGFDLKEFTNQVMVVGMVTAVLTLIGGLVKQTSVIALLVKITQSVFSLVLIVVFLGAGNIMSLGYFTFDLDMDSLYSSITMDLRVFVYVSIASILLKVVQIYLEWKEAKIETAPPGRLAP